MTDLAIRDNQQGATLERVMLQGDLKALSETERVAYYKAVCDSLGLNPLTRPFEYITLNNKLTLYARKDATEQLRKRDHISIVIAAREMVEGVYVVTARATTPDGRTDESIGAVPVDNLKGEARANAFMKAETKSKRRVTLSICGLGMLDETEVETIPGAVIGEIVESSPVVSLPPPPVVESTAKPKQGLPPVERGPVSPRQRAQLQEKFGQGGAELLTEKSLDEFTYADAEHLLKNGNWWSVFCERAKSYGFETEGTVKAVLRGRFTSSADVVAMFDALQKAQEGAKRQEEEEGIIEADAVREEIPF